MSERNLEETVSRVVLQIVQRKTPALTQVSSAQLLSAELGLASLDVAELVANLEMQLGVDPFATHVSITSVQTVGDLVNAYRMAGAR
jgi:acyl carrier protein